MKKAIAITLMTTTLGGGWFGFTLNAGGGHEHGPGGHTHSHAPVKEQVSTNEVISSANQHVQELVKAKKIDAGWEECAPLKTEQKRFNANLEWVVTYQNTKVTDPAKQNLYVFVDLYGKVKAANHSGK